VCRGGKGRAKLVFEELTSLFFKKRINFIKTINLSEKSALIKNTRGDSKQ